MTAPPAAPHPRPALILPPYAQALGVTVDHWLDDAPVLGCDYGPHVIGRPGFWHGGAMSGLLEMAAIAAVRAQAIERARLKPVNVTVQFLRGGVDRRMFAVGRVVRAGRRLINLSAEAWQEDRARLLATAQMQVVLAPAPADQ